jgi:hypothetical protein
MIRKFVMIDITVNEAQTKQFEGASDLLFYNKGLNDININSQTLLPGDTLSHPAFGDEENLTQYNISFPGGASTLIVTKKVYQTH